MVEYLPDYTLQVCNLSAIQDSPGGYGTRQAGLRYALVLLDGRDWHCLQLITHEANLS